MDKFVFRRLLSLLLVATMVLGPFVIWPRIKEAADPYYFHGPLRTLDGGAPDDVLNASPIVLAIFWQSTCPYCMAELREMASIYTQLREASEGVVEIVAINVKESEKTVRRVLEEEQWPFPVLIGSQPPANGLPFNLLVVQGEVVFEKVGQLSAREFLGMLQQILEVSPASQPGAKSKEE